jgi:hypothetical protein
LDITAGDGDVIVPRGVTCHQCGRYAVATTGVWQQLEGAWKAADAMRRADLIHEVLFRVQQAVEQGATPEDLETRFPVLAPLLDLLRSQDWPSHLIAAVLGAVVAMALSAVVGTSTASLSDQDVVRIARELRRMSAPTGEYQHGQQAREHDGVRAAEDSRKGEAREEGGRLKPDGAP